MDGEDGGHPTPPTYPRALATCSRGGPSALSLDSCLAQPGTRGRRGNGKGGKGVRVRGWSSPAATGGRRTREAAGGASTPSTPPAPCPPSTGGA
eukprot:scaffold9813_cov99-Isochrysis_galbana.AAC.4